MEAQELTGFYHIGQRLYRELADRYEKYAPECCWDCIELPEAALTYSIDQGQVVDVQVFDVDDNELKHDFSEVRFIRAMREWNEVKYLPRRVIPRRYRRRGFRKSYSRSSISLKVSR